jgi:hypothetical protein
MRKATFWIAAAALSSCASAFLPTGAVAQSYRDVPVCYKTKEYNNDFTRLVLDIKYHSRLPTTRAGGRQDVWDADGKHANTEKDPSGKPKNIMAVFDGAIVTSSGSKSGTYSQLPGSHLGGTSYFVRGGSGLGPKGGTQYPIYWECTSDEYSPAPKIFYCSIQSQGFGGTTMAATLEKLAAPDAYCDVFQDTKDSYPPPKPD